MEVLCRVGTRAKVMQATGSKLSRLRASVRALILRVRRHEGSFGVWPTFCSDFASLLGVGTRLYPEQVEDAHVRKCYHCLHELTVAMFKSVFYYYLEVHG